MKCSTKNALVRLRQIAPDAWEVGGAHEGFFVFEVDVHVPSPPYHSLPAHTSFQ